MSEFENCVYHRDNYFKQILQKVSATIKDWLAYEMTRDQAEEMIMIYYASGRVKETAVRQGSITLSGRSDCLTECIINLDTRNVYFTGQKIS